MEQQQQESDYLCEILKIIFEEDKKNIYNCLKKNWISSEGSFVKEFENKFSKYNSLKNMKENTKMRVPLFDLRVQDLDLRTELMEAWEPGNLLMMPAGTIKRTSSMKKDR